MQKEKAGRYDVSLGFIHTAQSILNDCIIILAHWAIHAAEVMSYTNTIGQDNGRIKYFENPLNVSFGFAISDGIQIRGHRGHKILPQTMSLVSPETKIEVSRCRIPLRCGYPRLLCWACRQQNDDRDGGANPTSFLHILSVLPSINDILRKVWSRWLSKLRTAYISQMTDPHSVCCISDE